MTVGTSALSKSNAVSVARAADDEAFQVKVRGTYPASLIAGVMKASHISASFWMLLSIADNGFA